MSQSPAFPAAAGVDAAPEADRPDGGAVTPIAGARRDAAVPCISSAELLRGTNEVLIEHHGALYRLRQTSLGKLILTK